MLQTRFGKTLTSAVVAVAAGLGAAGSAQAVVYKGAFDPSYGTPFPGLWWTATVIFDVPPTYLVDPNLTQSFISCPDCTIKSAEVDFYNSNPQVLNAPPTASEAFILNPNVAVQSIDIASGLLIGLSTDTFARFIPSSDGAMAAYDGGGSFAFSLALLGETAQLYYINPTNASVGCITDSNPLTTCGQSANFAVGTITPVPEPQTYALMLAGLGMVGFVARRRRQ